MYKYVHLSLLVILFLFVYKILCLVFNVEDNKVKKKYASARVVPLKKKRSDYMFAKYIKLPDYRKQEMEEQLFSLNIDMTAEQYVSSYIYSAIFPLIVAISAGMLGFKEVLVAGVIYAAYTFNRNKNKMQRALDFRRLQIEDEAPDLIRYFLVSLQNNTDLKEIFRSYKDVAKYLKRDISLCVMDMESTRTSADNTIYALERLDDRLNTPILSDFISGLINQSLGKNQESYFLILERDLKDLALNNLMRKARKVEGKIRPNFYLLIGAYILITMAMMIVFVATTMSY